jgi:hypothetical protein
MIGAAPDQLVMGVPQRWRARQVGVAGKDRFEEIDVDGGGIEGLEHAGGGGALERAQPAGEDEAFEPLVAGLEGLLGQAVEAHEAGLGVWAVHKGQKCLSSPGRGPRRVEDVRRVH